MTHTHLAHKIHDNHSSINTPINYNLKELGNCASAHGKKIIFSVFIIFYYLRTI